MIPKRMPSVIAMLKSNTTTKLKPTISPLLLRPPRPPSLRLATKSVAAALGSPDRLGHASTPNPPGSRGGGGYYTKIQDPRRTQVGCVNFIFADPEAVLYLDYNSDIGQPEGPDPTIGHS
jgi:hypothetical protein